MDRILKLLPGFNCSACGYSRCDKFAEALIKKKEPLSKCKVLSQERFLANKSKIQNILDNEKIVINKEKIIGVLDKYEADFLLDPLKDERSCREKLSPFSRQELQVGQIIRYRPLGCPITHFAEIIEAEHGLITVVMIGPCKRLNINRDFIEIGICMVVAFEGTVNGDMPNVGETVRFLPSHCMMQKVHSGVVVHAEGNKIIIDAIDLKVWEPAKKMNK